MPETVSPKVATQITECIELSRGYDSELARSASEASRINSLEVDVERYLDPPASTVYELEYAFHLLGDLRGKTVLDFGCGSGENIIPLAKRGAKVIGVDLSPDLIDVARRRAEKYAVAADFRVASAYETGLCSGSVDVVFCIAVLHHLDVKIAKREIRRVLKPGGLFIMTEPVRFSWTIKQLRKIFPTKLEVSDDEYPLNKEQLGFLISGLQVISSRNFRSVFSIPFLRIATPFAKIIRRCDAAALRTLPGMSHYATIRAMALKEPLSSPRRGPA